MQGIPCSEIILSEKIKELYDELKKYFPFAMDVNRIDIINNVRNRLNTGKAFPILTAEDRKFMMIRELFIYKQLKNPKKYNQDVLKNVFIDVKQETIDEELSENALRERPFSFSTDVWCKYCTNREICLDYYAHIE
jgi:hypothetical protein